MVLKKGKYLVLAAGLTLLLAGCGSASSSSKDAYYLNSPHSSTAGAAYNDNGGYAEEAMEYDGEYDSVTTTASDGWGEDGQSSANNNNDVASDRKLIRTVNLSVETKTYEELMDTVDRMVKDMGGYIENMDSNNGSIYSNYRSSRSASMTIRIPKTNVDAFLEFVEGNANILRRNENIEDITLNYTDLESRKKALKVEYDRLLAILEKAEQLEDIIMLEDRLSNVRYEMENLEKSLRRYDDKVDYSTIYLSISEVEELTPVEEETVVERMRNGFSNSLENIKDSLIDLAVDLVINAPYLVILTILFVICIVVVLIVIKVILVIVKKQNKKGTAVKAKAQNKPDEKKQDEKKQEEK